MPSLAPLHLASTHLRLKPDGRAERLPVTPQFWPDLIAGKYGDFHNEYLVTTHAFDADWTTWECHPRGDEVVVLLNGAVDLILETLQGLHKLELRVPGAYGFVPMGTWHTANPLAPSTLLFITAGEGTQVRPREQ